MRKWALYDLSVNPPAFDFLVFLQKALEKGATAVWFMPGDEAGIKTDGGKRELKSRLDHVAIPLCNLFGLEHQIGPLPEGVEFVWPDKSRGIVAVGGRLHKFRAHCYYWLKTLKEPFPVMPSSEALDKVNDKFKGKRPIVVTIRQATERPLRNSSPDWRTWALDHEAILLEDWCISRMSIDERVAHYELASLNIGAWCGQMHLNILSRRPYLALRVLNNHYRHDGSVDWFAKYQWKPGDQMPWADKTQRLVWNYDDDYETIEREFKRYMSCQ